MSTNCPPQLQLSLQTNTTSFKRSFEQFGFDLESPGDATDAGGSGGSGGNNGNDRNKRARSASSFSEDSDSMDSSHLSTIASGSSGSSPSRHGDANDPTSSIAVLGASLSTHSALEPPRLPTPDIQDIEMPDYPVDNSESFSGSLAPHVPDPEDRYRLPMDHFNPFRNESGLRRPQSSSSLVPRSPTAPPVLPPLYISDDQTRLSTSPIPFLNQSPRLHSASHTDSFFDDESPSSIRTQSPTTDHGNSRLEEQGQDDPLFQNEFQPTRDSLEFSVPSNRLQSVSNNTNNSRSERRAVPPTSNPAHFRDHLNSALDLLRSSSPLVPEFEDVGREAGLTHSHVNNRISRALPNPPTLPQIVTNTDVDISPEVFTPDEPSASSFTSSTINFDSSTSTSSSRSLDLGDHPLPSPVLHDLHSWMDASTSNSAHSWDTSQISASSVTTDSRLDFSTATNHQGTFATSSSGQNRADRGYTPSIPQQLTSSSPTVLTPPPLRHRRFMRMSDSNLQSNQIPSSIGLPPLSFNRLSADEVAVRSLDQVFDSRLSSASARPALGGSTRYFDRLRVHESQLADEGDTGDREGTFQRNLLAATLERRRASRETLAEFLRRTGDVPDSGDNGSAGPLPPMPQATARYSDPDSQMINSSTFAGSRTGFNNDNNSRDLHLRHRLRGYGTQMTRPGASNSLVNESAVEARRLADRLEVLERMNEVSREDNGSSISGALGDSLDSHLRSLEADLRENGMSSVGWDPGRLNRRSFGPTNDSEESRRPWYSWRQPPIVNRRSSFLPSLPQHNILPLPGLSSNDDMDMMIGESIGFRPTDFTSASSNNNNTRNNPILPSSLYGNHMSSRSAGRPSDYFWLNSSRPSPADQNSMDTGISSELPSPAPETEIFNSRYSTISDMANTIGGMSSSRGGGQRRHSASSDSSHGDNVHETRSNQPYLSDPPSLPPPDLGGVFDAERHASSIAISDETPENIYVHPPRRPLRDTSGISQFNLPFTDRPPPSIPIQDDSNSATANNSNIRVSYADIRRQASATSDLEALIYRERRSQLEARRINLAEEIRGMVGTSSNNSVANPMNTQSQSVSDLNRSSVLGRNYCNTTTTTATTIQPTERRNHSRTVPSTSSEPPFSRYQGLDPSSFTPGPFRNTVQQLLTERRHVQRRPDPSPSVAPTIPPLTFEDNDLSTTLQQRILLHQLRRPTETAQASSSTSARDSVDDRLRRERAIAEEGLRREQQQAMSLRRMSDRLAAARGINESNRRRETSDIHRYLTHQARMEGSRLEDPETPVSSRGLSNAIDVLRHDDLNTARTQQLIERFHREREGIRTRVVGTEPESTTPGVPASSRRPDGRRFLRESIMRREIGDEDRRSAYTTAQAAAVAQHINQEEQRDPEDLGVSQSMRGRRGRFPRAPGEVMYSLGRHARRVGTFGDYMRDEDFDESYEGLLSLSAALGEVKPKSTPASILSELETAQYKDWATSESDQRCPICLDDYQPTDQVLKLNNCSHWLHKDCLQQWLQGARTCPVCRKSVYMTTPQASSSARRLHPRHPHTHYPIFGGANPSWRRDNNPPHPPPPPGVGPI